MTENERKLLDQILSEAAVYGRINGTVQDLIRAVQMERATPMAREEYLRARIRCLRENNSFQATYERLKLPEAVTDALDLEAVKVVTLSAAPDLDEPRGAMTPEKLKAYTGRDFDR